MELDPAIKPNYSRAAGNTLLAGALIGSIAALPPAANAQDAQPAPDQGDPCAVRDALYNQKSTMPEALEILIPDRDCEVQTTLAQNPNLKDLSATDSQLGFGVKLARENTNRDKYEVTMKLDRDRRTVKVAAKKTDATSELEIATFQDEVNDPDGLRRIRKTRVIGGDFLYKQGANFTIRSRSKSGGKPKDSGTDFRWEAPSTLTAADVLKKEQKSGGLLGNSGDTTSKRFVLKSKKRITDEMLKKGLVYGGVEQDCTDRTIPGSRMCVKTEGVAFRFNKKGVAKFIPGRPAPAGAVINISRRR
jgi:hypothetical protein